MAYQYLHDNKFLTIMEQPKTYVFELPDYYLMEAMVSKTVTDGFTNTLSMNVGIARLHKEDKYVKAIGREIAKKNIKKYSFSIERIVIHTMDKEIVVFLKSKNDDLRLTMIMKQSYKTLKIIMVNHIGMY